MKRNVKFLVGGLVGVAVVAAAYFGASGGLFQGKLALKNNKATSLAANNITKGEFVKLLVKSMKVDLSSVNMDDCPFSSTVSGPHIPGFSNSSESSGNSVFATISKNNEIAPYVCFLYKNNMYADSVTKPFTVGSSISRKDAASFFNWSYLSEIELGKAIKPYPMIDACDSSGKCMYSDVNSGTLNWSSISNLATLGVFDVQPWMNVNFNSDQSLTYGKAQYWANNFSKLIK